MPFLKMCLPGPLLTDSGSSHCRSFPEDSERGGEEEEEGGEEERNQERPSHLSLSLRAVAPHLSAREEQRKGVEEEGAFTVNKEWLDL